jgi:hypothetical protein
MLAHVLDLAVRAKARVLGQYQKATRLVALAGEVGGWAQELEDALWALGQATTIDGATGIWLDRLGALVGEERGGASDADYRGFIRARIRALRSSGRVEDLLAVLTAWSSRFYVVVQKFPAGVEVSIGDTTTEAEAARVQRLVRGARSAAVGLMLRYDAVDPGDTFTFATGSSRQIDSALGTGDTTNVTTGGHLAGAVRA